MLARDGKWKSFEDPFTEKNSWYDDSDNRKRFKTPAGKNPPYGNVAKGWFRSPKEWRWIGWRVWHCYYEGTYVQRFEHGFIIGAFRRKLEVDPLGIVYVLTDDNQWKAEVLKGEGPLCIPAPTDKNVVKKAQQSASPR